MTNEQKRDAFVTTSFLVLFNTIVHGAFALGASLALLEAGLAGFIVFTGAYALVLGGLGKLSAIWMLDRLDEVSHKIWSEV
jgi:hypothetical protein